MFDMQKIGKRIAALRREQGMTQMALADKMNISYQAVSNWERGNTMPDISKLPELAEIFGVSMEEILCDGRKAKIVEDIAEGKTPADITAEELTDIAPIATREQFKRTYTESDGKKRWNIADLAAFAPFLEEEDLMEFASEALGEDGSLAELSSIAPFMDEKDLGTLALRAASKESKLSELVAIAPFMNQEDVGRAASTLVEMGCGVTELAALAPFMDEKYLSAMVGAYLAGGGDFKDLVSIAPFLDSSVLKEIFKSFCK